MKHAKDMTEDELLVALANITSALATAYRRTLVGRDDLTGDDILFRWIDTLDDDLKPALAQYYEVLTLALNPHLRYNQSDVALDTLVAQAQADGDYDLEKDSK